MKVSNAHLFIPSFVISDLRTPSESAPGDGELMVTEEQRKEKDIERQTLLNHMHLMRMRLMHFVNSLHNYIMTRVSRHL